MNEGPYRTSAKPPEPPEPSRWLLRVVFALFYGMLFASSLMLFYLLGEDVVPSCGWALVCVFVAQHRQF